MELKLHRLWNFRVVWVGMMLVLLLGSTNPTHAIDYHVEEDFSNGNNWTFQGTDWSAVGGASDVVEIDYSAEIVNGELVFAGTPNNTKLDGAHIEDTTAYGTWSFDVFVPSNAPILSGIDRSWGMIFSDLPMGSDEGETNFGQFVLDFYNETLKFDRSGSYSSIRLETLENVEFDTYQHYDLLRTEDRVYVFLDNDLVMNTTFIPTVEKVVNYVTIVAVQGSGIKFDNFSISADIDEEMITVDTFETTDPEPLYVGLGGLAIATSGVIGYRTIKKKRWQRLVRLATNGTHPQVNQTISHLFQDNTQLYLFLLGNRKIAKELGVDDDVLDASLASEMQKYRSLLHPIKLSILQVLNVNNKISSIEVKNKLNLNWSEFHSNITSLEKSGMIQTVEDFDEDGSKRQFLVMEEYAKKEYIQLIRLIDTFVERAKEFIPGYSKDFLYPQS